MEFRRLWIQR
jgi:hypothetical protein